MEVKARPTLRRIISLEEDLCEVVQRVVQACRSSDTCIKQLKITKMKDGLHDDSYR